jgi:hypothetical protein
MPPIPVRQSSFHAGEVAPNLFSRTDIPTRKFAVRSLLNFIPTATGAALNRPGLKYVGAIKDQSHRPRLIPFTFSTSQAYLLEFGHLYVRIWQGGVLLSAAGSPAWSNITTYVKDQYVTFSGLTYRALQNANTNHQPDTSPTWWSQQNNVELTTTYTDTELPRLQYVQYADTLTLTHPNHAPAELKRTSATAWVLSDFSTARSASVTSGIHTTTTLITTADDTHDVQPWQWVVTSVDYNDVESIVASVLAPSACQRAPDRTIGLACNAAANAKLYYWYAGKYSVWGYIGSSGTPQFVDDGKVPNYSEQPPLGLNPFIDQFLAPQNPAVATYFQQRQVFANQTSFPQKLRMSKTGYFHDFDYSNPQKKNDAIDFTVASRMYEEIRALIPLQQLVVLTANTEYAVDAGDQALAFDNFQLVPIGYNGCSWVRPLICSDSILYLPPAQSSVRELTFHGADGWGSGDVSLTANHLLSASGRTIVDWAFQKLPFSVAWCVRDDGSLISLTYDTSLKVMAWARHYSFGDSFESVASLPEGSEDVLYAAVNRGGSRNIERLAKRTAQTNIVDGNFLDASIEILSGPVGPVISGLSHLNGRQVYALRDGIVEGPFTVASGQITLSAQGSKIFVGLAYNCDIEPLDISVDPNDGQGDIGPDQKLVSSVIWEVDGTAGLMAGETFSDLIPWVAPMGYVTPAGGLANDLFVVPIDSSWNRYGRAVLRQSKPLPVSVLAVTRMVEVGGV